MKRKNGEGDMLSPVSEHAVMPLSSNPYATVAISKTDERIRNRS